MDVAQTIDGLNNKKLNPHKDKIVECFKKNDIDFSKLKGMKRRDFIALIVEHCGEKNIKGAVAQLWKALEKQKKAMEENEADEIKQEPKNILDEITESIGHIVDNGDILNSHKASIIEYFTNNKIDYNKLKDMDQTQLANEIIDYCLKKDDYGEIKRDYVTKQMPTYINRAV